MVTSREIVSMHKKIERRLSQFIGNSNENWIIRPKDEYIGWEKIGVDGSFEFFLFSDHSFDSGLRLRGGKCPVISIKTVSAPYEPRIWFSWHEEWKRTADRKMEKEKFVLVDAGWTFFWGIRQRDKDQIFRAEWGQFPYCGKTAPQPHWHIDPDLMVTIHPLLSEPQTIPRSDSSNLEELLVTEEETALETIPDEHILSSTTTESIQDISMQGMHLGMGGWKGKGRDHQHWQYQIEENNLDELVEWSERVLQSAIRQFEEFRTISEIVA
ncbi:MAG: hypothetical protein P9X24_01725 [Candidatus Hatepunaea meridiana]|nr:hypothetical protein [Candidatus Hatepunaea meridiana]